MTNDGESQKTMGIENDGADLPTIMASYVLLFGLMGRILYSYPDFAWIESLVTEGVFEDIPIDSSNREIRSGQDLLLLWSKENSDEFTKDTFDDLQSDYVRLFISGNDSLQVHPWESVFVNRHPTLFQQSTIRVRKWYKRFGLELENKNQEPDDHIGLELIFVSHLSALALGFLDASNETDYDKTIEDLSNFTTEHLFRWAPHWCDLVIENSKTDFYRGVALLTKGILISLAAFLQVDIVVEVFR